jgi:hypothetical protein
MVFVSNNQTPIVLKPSKESLNFPSTFITPEFAAVLGSSPYTVPFMRRDHFNAAALFEMLIKAITIIGLIANKLVRSIFGKTAVYGILNKLYFMGRSTFHVSGDRKTRSVCDRHDLGPLATLCLADSKTPFFAGAKQPSMNASRISILPRSFRSSTSSLATRWKIPCLTHCWNRLWHVWYGGYRCGISFQGAPVRNIHKMPFKISRGSRWGRPLGSFLGVSSLIIGSIRFHCPVVSSILIILHNQKLMSSFF